MCVWYKTFKICENATKCRLWQIDAANLSFSWLIAISWNVFMLFIEIIFKFLNMILCSKEWKCIINESSVNNWLQWLSFLQGWNTPLTDRTLPPLSGYPQESQSYPSFWDWEYHYHYSLYFQVQTLDLLLILALIRYCL